MTLSIAKPAVLDLSQGPARHMRYRRVEAVPTFHPMTPDRVWFLIANERSAQVYRGLSFDGASMGRLIPVEGGIFRRDPPQPLTELRAVKDYRSAMAQMSGRAGSVLEAERSEADDFLRGVARWLSSPAMQILFDRLVLVAPFNDLIVLKGWLSPRAMDRLQAEIDADLTLAPVLQLERKLAPYLIPAANDA